MTNQDEIAQLRDAIRGTLGTSKDDAPIAPEPEWRAGWAGLANLGLTGLCVRPERGGSGIEVGAAVATAEELGAALHGSPFAGLTASAHALGQQDEEGDGLLAGIRYPATREGCPVAGVGQGKWPQTPLESVGVRRERSRLNVFEK